jgi:hypothetical protein
MGQCPSLQCQDTIALGNDKNQELVKPKMKPNGKHHAVVFNRSSYHKPMRYLLITAVLGKSLGSVDVSAAHAVWLLRMAARTLCWPQTATEPGASKRPCRYYLTENPNTGIIVMRAGEGFAG